MAPEFQAVVRATQVWLETTWHVQVPFAWLEACVSWLQEEAGGAGHLSQLQINQQALDQWLLADLRDLNHPVLPEGLSQVQKTQVNGAFCVQVDSLLDVSQPAYGQLRKMRGTVCENDEVSAVTQATQRPWESKPTRMLMLQVTDGVQNLEAMEYQPIPELSAALRPGVKLQLRGQMVCRLGVLLLGPSNVKVLGGEVEELVDRNNQDRVLCRTLGLPEEEQRPEEPEENPPAPQQGGQDMEDLELDDRELLASLEVQEVVERRYGEQDGESGYGTLSDTFTQSSRSSSVRGLVSASSLRSEASISSYRGGLAQSNRDASVQRHRHGYEQEHSDLSPSDHLGPQEIHDHHMEDEDFPDEDFDNLPLDELDAVIFEDGSDPQINRASGNPQTAQNALNSTFSGQKGDCPRGASAFPPAASRDAELLDDAGSGFLDDDMDCLLVEVRPAGSDQPSGQAAAKKRQISSSSCSSDTAKSVKSPKQSYTTSAAGFDGLDAQRAALSLTSPPFTYLCLLEQTMSQPDFCAAEIRLKAFIVTLLGRLNSRNGVWNVCVTISDGTGHLDVELSDEVLTGLLGFSVPEKAALKRDPARRGELDAGIRRCQEELVDMCCVMTVTVEGRGRRAVVTKVEPVSEEVLQELERRVKDRRK